MRTLLMVVASIIGTQCVAHAEPTPAERYPEAQLTATNAPIVILHCDYSDASNVRCREVRIGMRDGKLVSEGDLPLDEALSLTAQPTKSGPPAPCDHLLASLPPQLPKECR